ncbi:MAG TPA: ATP-binding protein [Solirubrobacterales bacterium]|nr:ATP-binding protein [Solirubrobacterales bacterium]
MSVEAAELIAAWPVGVSLAAAAAVHGLREGRRRATLNEALHELRRPLQALALATPAGRAEPAAIEGSLRMAASALERLEHEINGEEGDPAARSSTLEPVAPRPLLEAAIARWRPRAALSGSSLRLRWRAGEAEVLGDRCFLAQALDNLVVNAIEHGGPEIVLAGQVVGGRLRLAVIDSGRSRSRRQGERPAPCGGRGAGRFAQLSGRRRRGHGLRIVRRTAAALGGEFHLRVSDLQTRAVLELPLAGSKPLAHREPLATPGRAGRVAA